jgi:Ca2+/H+ antiporter
VIVFFREKEFLEFFIFLGENSVYSAALRENKLFLGENSVYSAALRENKLFLGENSVYSAALRENKLFLGENSVYSAALREFKVISDKRKSERTVWSARFLFVPLHAIN